MKRLILSVSILLSLASIGQVPVIYYDFEDNANRTNLEMSVEQAMTTGNSSVTRASASGIGLVKTSGAGTTLYNGGGQAGTGIASSGWPTASSDPGVQATEYFQVTVNTTGLYGLSLSFDMDKDNNGQSPAKVGALWSTNGVLFSAVASPVALANNSYQTVRFDLPSGAENRSSLTIRIYAFDSKKLSASANFDNFTLWATTISGVRNLLDYDAYGLSLASGTANTPRFAGNLNVNGSGTVISLNSKLNLGGTVAVGSGATFGFGTNGRLIGGGDVDLANNSTLQISSTNGSSALKGNIGSSALVALPAATVEFMNATARQYQDAAVFGNVVVNNPNGLTLTGDVVVNGDLSLKSGTLTGGANQLTIGGTLSRVNGVLDASSTEVVFNGSRSQSIAAGLFTGALKKLNSSNAVDLTWATNLTVTDGVTLGSGTLKPGTNTLTLGGPVVRNGSTQTGTLDASSASVIFNGSALQTVDAGSFGATIKNVTVSNAAGVSLAGNNTVDGALTLTNGTLTITGGTLTLPVTPVRTAGSLNAATGGVVLNGTATQVLPAGLFSGAVKNFTAANAAGVVLNDDLTVTTALTLQAGSLSLNGRTVTVDGTVSGAGTFRGSATSGLTVASTGVAGTLNFDQTTDGTTNALGLLTVNSGMATLGGKLTLYTGLNVAGGSLDLAAKNLVLKSLPAQTAYVAELKGSLTGESNVTVERFSPSWSSRRWRLVTAPILNTTINATWQEGTKWNGSPVLPATGYGTLITGQTQGSAATANGNGFDFWSAVAGGSASIKSYTAGSTTGQAYWSPVTSTLTPGAFDKNQAYLLYIRGDRSLSAGSTPGSTTLRSNGKLKKGSFTVSVPTTNSHTLIGNPYPAPLDFKAVFDANSSKIQPWFWIWQSSLGTGTGGYVLVQPVAPGSSLYETIPSTGKQSAQNRLIHSGEGFFVVPKTTAGADNVITIQESHKSTGVPSVSVFREMDQAPAKLYVNLLTTAGGDPVLLDGALSQFSNGYPVSGGTNVAKAVNSGENLSIVKGGSDFILSSAPVSVADTLNLHLWGTTAKTYQLEITTANLGSVGLSATLVDKYLNKETAVVTSDATTPYTFSVTSDAASKDPNRFFIALKSTPVLPLSLTSFKATESNGVVSLEWTNPNESGVRFYQLERSTDGSRFSPLSQQEARSAAGAQTYQYRDLQPPVVAYYRVQVVGTSGAVQYSTVVKVQGLRGAENLSLYPNPATGSVVNLQFTNKPQGLYTLTLYTMAGQPVLRKTVQHSGGNATEMLVLGDLIVSGSYRLEAVREDGAKDVLNLSVQR